MALSTDLTKLYDKCCEGYHKVDDFRSKLLGILPLASGIAVLSSLYVEKKSGNEFAFSIQHLSIGVFGFIVTIGLLIYELKGIEKCTQFIKLGKWIEGQMEKNDQNHEVLNNEGFFTELVYGNKYVNEPLATAIIYSIVLALWTFVVCLSFIQKEKYLISVIITSFVFFLSFFFIRRYWKEIVINNGLNDPPKRDNSYK